ncbi:MAG: hypothetical protein N2556_10105, partial [Anaerolineae bacterium]|nr:hypothetical protein [Anaerolineae bacterium]
MHIGIDYTAAIQQRAGIGRYTRELVGALLRLTETEGAGHRYTLFAAAGGRGLPPDLPSSPTCLLY